MSLPPLFSPEIILQISFSLQRRERDHSQKFHDHRPTVVLPKKDRERIGNQSHFLRGSFVMSPKDVVRQLDRELETRASHSFLNMYVVDCGGCVSEP